MLQFLLCNNFFSHREVIKKDTLRTVNDCQIRNSNYLTKYEI